MQTQTIFRAGNSQVVAIPRGLGKELGFKLGQKVVVGKAGNGEVMVVKKAESSSVKDKKTGVNAEFKKWLRTAIEEDAEILDELAVR